MKEPEEIFDKNIRELAKIVLENNTMIAFLTAEALAVLSVYILITELSKNIDELDVKSTLNTFTVIQLIKQSALSHPVEGFKERFLKTGISYVEAMKKIQKDNEQSEELLNKILKDLNIET